MLSGEFLEGILLNLRADFTIKWKKNLILNVERGNCRILALKGRKLTPEESIFRSILSKNFRSWEYLFLGQGSRKQNLWRQIDPQNSVDLWSYPQILDLPESACLRRLPINRLVESVDQKFRMTNKIPKRKKTFSRNLLPPLGFSYKNKQKIEKKKLEPFEKVF